MCSTGSITTCAGARRGGSTSPSSSEWVITMPPISLVETPQLVVHAYSCEPLSERNFMPLAFAKFCPRKCDVPACKAFLSCIIASMQ